jgi:hypothetical protein
VPRDVPQPRRQSKNVGWRDVEEVGHRRHGTAVVESSVDDGPHKFPVRRQSIEPVDGSFSHPHGGGPKSPNFDGLADVGVGDDRLGVDVVVGGHDDDLLPRQHLAETEPLVIDWRSGDREPRETGGHGESISGSSADGWGKGNGHVRELLEPRGLVRE